MDEYCPKHPNVKMQLYGGYVYRGEFCPVCKSEEEAKKSQDIIAAQTEALAAEQAHQNFLLEKQVKEEREHREEQKRYARKERDASYLRKGILEFDEAYQREWEECTTQTKQLKSKVSQLEAKLEDGISVLSAFRAAYDISEDHEYRNEISDTLDIRFGYRDWSHKLEEICRNQNEIVQQISGHKTSVEGELTKLKCPHNVLSATESIGRVLNYRASNRDRIKGFKYNIDFKPRKGWLLTSLAFFTLNIACNAMCAENAYDFRTSGFAGFLLLTSAILMAVYVIQLIHRSRIVGRLKRLNSLYDDEYNQRKIYFDTVIQMTSEARPRRHPDEIEAGIALIKRRDPSGIVVLEEKEDEFEDEFEEEEQRDPSEIELQYWIEIGKCLVKHDSDSSLGRKVFDFLQEESTLLDELRRTRAEYRQVMKYRDFMRSVVHEVGEAICNGERVPRNKKSLRISVIKCPSCAGPLPDNLTKKCPYCDNALTF